MVFPVVKQHLAFHSLTRRDLDQRAKIPQGLVVSKRFVAGVKILLMS
jgi:hypothetical protein